MNAERKEYRALLKQSLRKDFERIVYDAKLSEEEEAIVRMVIEKKYSYIKTAMSLHISESSVYRIMREFYERTQAILLRC